MYSDVRSVSMSFAAFGVKSILAKISSGWRGGGAVFACSGDLCVRRELQTRGRERNTALRIARGNGRWPSSTPKQRLKKSPSPSSLPPPTHPPSQTSIIWHVAMPIKNPRLGPHVHGTIHFHVGRRFKATSVQIMRFICGRTHKMTALSLPALDKKQAFCLISAFQVLTADLSIIEAVK